MQSSTAIGRMLYSRFALASLLALALVMVTVFGDVQGRSIRRGRVGPVTIKRCQSLGDPHFTTLNGLQYDFQGLGDYVFAKTRDGKFTVHTRTGRWGAGASVNVNAAVDLGNDRTFEYDVEQDVFYVDGEKTEIKVGQKFKLGSGTVERVGQTAAIVTSKNGARMTMNWYRHPQWKHQLGSSGYISLVIDMPSNVEVSQGLCLTQTHSNLQARGILHNHKARKIVRFTDPKKITARRKKWAKKVCTKAGLSHKKNPNAFRACVLDTIQSGKKIGKTIAKNIKKIKKLEKKGNKKYLRALKQKLDKEVSDVIRKKEIEISKLQKIAKEVRASSEIKKKKCIAKNNKKAEDAEHDVKKAQQKLVELTLRMKRRALRILKKAARKARKLAQKARRLARIAKRKATRKAIRAARKAKRLAKQAQRRARRLARKERALARKAKRAARRAAKKAAWKKAKQERAARRAARKARRAALKAARKARRAAKKAKKTGTRRARKSARRAKRAARKAALKAKRAQKKLEREKRRAARRAKRAARKARRERRRQCLRIA
ncbi:hypothetical protein C9374_001324 [Naegleria lovaniensis]|uniref:VWFD domain-containing protein n=1 Tax=Naegleria lovaniensis TaxID=51637 RepID=A0AA88KLC4_NAELO|nr:uncharacterized protein C9374_001324 [Naegleria lovaniensis]KAG2387730.1 hypothetical protein C9374_001324 [Naegleria lovaniensis]